MTQGIILAAGYSSRAETNKMLLTHKGRFLIAHAVEGMLPFVDEVIVVTGHYHEEVKEALKSYSKVTIVYNSDYSKGMFSSVQAGVRKTKGDFFILPGDCPFVSGDTYQKLLLGSKEMRVPVYQNRTGHPLFIKHSIKDELLNEPVTSNLKLFRNRHDYEIIKTEDSQILMDIDTPRDYQKL
ncbi:MAG: NTP transferase domain-containing protein [Bacilli bacterium]|jgi:molybdenum cofactor cytidylyltransferase|nr:NTP transferase domain-containing protein [Bacilli bacterium]MDD4006141.1 NTP transferase domain-containing protein [Bacilli bacterium]